MYVTYPRTISHLTPLTINNNQHLSPYSHYRYVTPTLLCFSYGLTGRHVYPLRVLESALLLIRGQDPSNPPHHNPPSEQIPGYPQQGIDNETGAMKQAQAPVRCPLQLTFREPPATPNPAGDNLLLRSKMTRYIVQYQSRYFFIRTLN